MMRASRFQQGLGAVMAIAILVILATLAAAMLRMGTVQQMSSAQDVQSARAWSAAKAGTEWGLFQALRNGWCDGGAANQFLDLSAETGFRVQVNCTSRTYSEGESAPGTPVVVRVFQVEATACNSATACPDAALAVSPGYIERRRQVVATN